MNVILIISDTLRRDHLGAYSNEWIHTPNLDLLAKHSFVFDEARAGSFPTVPNRCDVMTGRYTFIEFEWGPLPPDSTVISEVLGQAGYTTMLIADTPHPFRTGYYFQRGFAGYELIRGQEHDNWRTTPADPPLPCAPEKLRAPDTTVKQYLRNIARREREEDYFVAQTMRTAAEWLEENREQQFFLYVDTFDPHEPWDPPQHYVDLYNPDYDGEEIIYPRYDYADYLTDRELEHCRALYAGEVSLVDRWVGHLLERVEDLGLADETAIIFTTDHGFLHGEHGIIGKSLIGSRYFGYVPLWSEIARIPLMIRLPGQTQGKRLSGLAQPPDLMPTILELLDVADPGTTHGHSLAGVMTRGEAHPRQVAIVSPALNHDPNAGIASTITDGEWTLIYSGSPDSPVTSHGTRAVDSIERDTSAAEGVPAPQLYHLPSDPAQEQDVCAQHRDAAERLHAAHVAMLEEIGMREEYLQYRRQL